MQGRTRAIARVLTPKGRAVERLLGALLFALALALAWSAGKMSASAPGSTHAVDTSMVTPLNPVVYEHRADGAGAVDHRGLPSHRVGVDWR